MKTNLYFIFRAKYSEEKSKNRKKATFEVIMEIYRYHFIHLGNDFKDLRLYIRFLAEKE